MGLSETDRDPAQTPVGIDSAMPSSRRGSALERYRVYGRFPERYWSKRFRVTQADLARFATQMRESGRAMALTDLARDVIRAVLRVEPRLSSEPAAGDEVSSRLVRLWDPGANWREGDRLVVVVARPSQGRPYAPCAGEVIRIEDDSVVVHVDGMTAPQVFELEPGAPARQSELRESEMLGIGLRFDEDAQIDFVLWRYGPRALGRLLHALDADNRFVELEGLWFLRELAMRPRGGMLARLAATLFVQDSGPVRLDDVFVVLSLAGITQAAARFGLAKALDERPGLFENVGSAARPLWTLAGPPPLVFTAQHAVYDPETYVVLCLPGETLSAEVARQLWRADLLRAALRGAADEAVDAETSHEASPALRVGEQVSSPSTVEPVTAAPVDGPDVRRRHRWRLFSRGR